MAERREYVAAFTGHRSLPPDTAKLRVSAEKAIIELIGQGAVHFITGGAVGFDALAALVVLDLRDKRFSQIKLIQVLPFKGMEEKWDFEQQKTFHSINNRADKVEYLAESFTGNEQYHVRNRYLVDHAAHLIAFCKNTKARSGTASCYRYAVKQSINVILVDY